MHVHVSGDGGVPLLLLHSQFVGGRWFEHAVPLLDSDRIVIVPDRLGFGYSDQPDRPLDFGDFAASTVDALDALGIEQCDVVAIHSGGIEALELATAYPDRVRRVVLISLSIFTDEERRIAKEQFSGPPPELNEDGSHLLWYWQFWMNARPPDVGLDDVQGWVIDHLIASPNYVWASAAAIDYPKAEKISALQQPLLLLTPHDNVYLQTERAIPLLPPGSRVVDLPQVDSVMSTFTVHAREVVGHVRDFLS
jgi:pimeloyl-ACP methyl ester carboxylesterase